VAMVVALLFESSAITFSVFGCGDALNTSVSAPVTS